MNNPLVDVLPAKARKYAYAALGLAALGIAAWQASNGNWVEFAASMLGGLGFTTAASNTHPEG